MYQLKLQVTAFTRAASTYKMDSEKPQAP